MKNLLRRKQTEGDTARIKNDLSKMETQCGEMLHSRSAQRDQSNASAALEVWFECSGDEMKIRK